MTSGAASLPESHLASHGGDRIERYTFRERICHWLTGFTYLYCLLTGLAFYSPYLFWMAVVLGGGPTSRFWHPFTGLVFNAGVIWMHRIWRGDVRLSDADRAWLYKIESYATNRDDQVPAQDRFNSGQKVFYWAMFYGAFLLLLSGLVMWFPEYVPSGLRWIRPLAVLVHSASALITIGAFIIHVYMGIFVVPGSTTAIVHGFVSRDWARTHHRLWYDRVTRQRAARELTGALREGSMWDRRIDRAEKLVESHPESSSLLGFYRQLTLLQKTVFEDLQAGGQTDLRLLLVYFPALLELVERTGPERLSVFAREGLRSEHEREDLLRRFWERDLDLDSTPADSAKFFARVLLQPYAECLARRGAPDTHVTGDTCPFCSARPIVGVLRGEGEGAKRSLICSLCATEWQYRRILCPKCGEEHKDKLPVYIAEEIDYIRVEACDSCKTYIKSVDLTKNALAVPVVDELATVSLTIWAEEHGYAKLETNILGM